MGQRVVLQVDPRLLFSTARYQAIKDVFVFLSAVHLTILMKGLLRCCGIIEEADGARDVA